MDEWQTPQYILSRVAKTFPEGSLDPCPPNPEFDGLSFHWDRYGSCFFVNPPFSEMKEWVLHGLQQLEFPGNQMIWLCNHKHDTRWFRQLFNKASAWCLLTDRIKFVHPETGKQGSTLINQRQTIFFFGIRNLDLFEKSFSDIGMVMDLREYTWDETGKNIKIY